MLRDLYKRGGLVMINALVAVLSGVVATAYYFEGNFWVGVIWSVVTLTWVVTAGLHATTLYDEGHFDASMEHLMRASRHLRNDWEGRSRDEWGDWGDDE